MAKLDSIKKAKRNKTTRPFGEPSAEDNGRYEILIPEGAETGTIPDRDDYIGKLTRLIRNVSQQGKGNPQLVFTFAIVKGKYRGMDFDLYCPLIPNSLWKLADTLAALGVKPTPGQKQIVDRAKLIGTLVRLVIKKRPAQGEFRERSQIATVLPHPDGPGKKAKDKGTFVPPAEDEEPEEPEMEQDEEELEDDEAAQDEEDTDEEESDEEDDEEGEGDEDEEESEEEDENEESDEESDEDDEDEEEGDDWNVGKEADKFQKTAAKRGRGQSRLKKGDKDDEYTDVTPKRRRGPTVVERPVKKAKRGRPPGKKARR